MKKNIKIKWDIKKAGLFFMLMVVAVSAQASMSGSGYPWESTIGEIMNSLSGPVAYGFAGVAIIVSGLTMAFADLQGGAKKFIQAALGISIAFGATTLLSSPMFSFAGSIVH